MKIWWPKKPKPGNFGDVLTPQILSYFGISYEYNKENYDTLCVGSIAKMARKGVQVLGSGILNINEEPDPSAQWRFVRGPITRNCVLSTGGYCPPIYGDSALLLPLMCPESRKRYNIGIVPHYTEYEWVKKSYPEYHVINVLNSKPLNVAREITECQYIVSSSLHGIICAHAYGIPAAWVKFQHNVKGSDVKFYDYYASVGLPATLSTIDDLHFSAPESIDLDPIIDIFREVCYKQTQGTQAEFDFLPQYQKEL